MQEKISIWKQKMSELWNRYKTKKRFWLGIVVLIVAVVLVLRGGKDVEDGSTALVAKRDVVQSVVLSGKVQSGSAVDLNFADSGRVAYVNVSEGQKVRKGQILASLESGELQAELTIARAGLVNTTNNLEKITREQDALVANAYRALISEGLEAAPEDVDSTAEAPVISGTYVGDEGSYRIETYASSALSGYSFRVSGLEENRITGSVSTTAVPLGTRGLYIRFIEGENYANTAWIIEIPNKKSSVYVTNYNAYQSALATRDRVIADAQSDLAGSSTEASIAQARVDSINAQIAKRRIVAPFDGVVANVNVKTGETATSATGTSTESTSSAITLISEDDYEVLLKAPEIDIAKLAVGQKVSITLDAYGDQVFTGTIISINPAETIIDGVPVYETKVMFDTPDTRIRSGMTATATIIAAERDGVLAIPANFIHRDSEGGAQSFVYVMTSDTKTEKRIIQTGLRGSDSFVEVVSGLNEGEKIRVDAIK